MDSDSNSNLSPGDVGSISRSEDLPAREKTTAAVEEDNGLGDRPAKKARSGGGLVRNVRRVAEILLVLAAMGKARGGRNPTPAERELVAEAREKLAEVCGEFSPKDVFPRDEFGAVIEDLGLNRLREQKLGFRSPKISIAEKLLFTKQKMEKSEEFPLRSATHPSQRLQKNLGAAAENRGASHTTRMFPLDKSSPASISSGSFKPASPLGHVSAANSTPLLYQLPASEVRTSMISGGLPTSLPGRDSSSSALARVEKPHIRLDPRSNGSSYTTQIQANSSGNHTRLKTPALNQEVQSGSSGKTGPDSKVLSHPPVKVEGTVDRTKSRIATQSSASKPLITQSSSGHPSTMHQQVQGMNFVSNVHCEIGKIVQKLLQPQFPGHPTWTPPSRDYMNKAMTCQVCKYTINEVENVLVCDACEKGYHLKCLQSHNQKGIPRGEWHCFKCLSLSNGKPLPPKYGRVTRNINAPKAPSNTASIQSSEKKVVTLSEQGNQQKIIANGSSDSQKAPTGGMGSNHNHSASGSNMSNARELDASGSLPSRKMDDKRYSETCQAADSSVERSCEGKFVFELKGQSPEKSSETVSKIFDHLQASSNPQDNDQKGLPIKDGIPLNQCHGNNLTIRDLVNINSSTTFDGNPKDDIKQEERGVAQPEPAESSGTDSLVSNQARPSSDGSNDVDWIGDILQVVDGKTYYQSCFIDGVVYKLQDHALFLSKNDQLMPSKLQAMWEDNKTRSKWVLVNRCYLPGDLPERVGRPCYPESNEVYESNHGNAIKAGLIRGPCEVLPTGKFIEESRRRSRLGNEANNELWPLFLCKWFYDESKGVFRDVSC